MYDVSPIKKGGFPASHVSLLEGTSSHHIRNQYFMGCVHTELSMALHCFVLVETKTSTSMWKKRYSYCPERFGHLVSILACVFFFTTMNKNMDQQESQDVGVSKIGVP